MKNYLLAILLVSAVAVLGLSNAHAQDNDLGEVEGDRRAQTGLKFLGLSPSPRTSALGGAVTAGGRATSEALFSNPAHMGRMERAFDAAFNQVDWIADISYNSGSMAVSPANGAYGTFGVSLVFVDYGEFIGTRRAGDTEEGFVDTGAVTPSAMAIGFGYARELTDRFAVGGQAKFARQDLGESTMRHFSEHNYSATQQNTVNTIAFDFGIVYSTGFESLDFAVSARNFSRELRYEEFGFELPLNFSIGLSMDMLDLTQADPDIHSFVLSVDGERPRDFSEQVRVGGEYTFMDMLAVRGGYVYPSDEAGISLGAGLKAEILGGEFGFDYSYSQMGIFNNVNRLGVRLGL
jgi:hypothetical protein